MYIQRYSERNSRWHHYTDEICRYKITVLIAENYTWLQVSPFSSTNCLWNEREKNYCRRMHLQKKYWALNGDIFTLENLSYICVIKCIYFLLITKITPWSTKSSITLQSSFKEFLTSVYKLKMGSRYYRDFFPCFSCWKRKVCKQTAILYISIYIYIWIMGN